MSGGEAWQHFPAAIESLQRGTAWTLVVSGELDVANAPRLQAALDEMLAANPRQVEIDLSEVSFIDSAGLRTLMGAKDSCDRREVELKLVESVHPGAMTVFEATGLGRLLRWSPQLERGDAGATARYECAKCGKAWTSSAVEPPVKCPSCYSRRIGRQVVVEPDGLGVQASSQPNS